MQGLDRAQLATLVVSVLVALVGLGFVGQGLGIITGGSFMVGDRTWAVIGAVLFAGGLWVAWRTWNHRR